MSNILAYRHWPHTSVLGSICGLNVLFFYCLVYFSNDEDEELQSTDPESKEKSKDKKTLCKVKWSRDEVSLSENLLEKI